MQTSTIFEPGIAAFSPTSLNPLLDLAVAESQSQGAYLYRVDLPESRAALVAWSGVSPVAAAVPLEFHGPAVPAHFARTAPQVLHEGAWQHPAFKPLPEFRRNRFEGVFSIPLLDAGRVVGLLHVCRAQRSPVRPNDLAFLLSLAVPIGALLAATAAQAALEREVERLNRELAGRKLLERAKGLLQARFSWTEEQAYFCLRNLSRRRRTPLAQVAEEVIATSAAGITGQEARRVA